MIALPPGQALVNFYIFIFLFLLGLDDFQEVEKVVLALPPDLLAPDIFRKIPGVRRLRVRN